MLDADERVHAGIAQLLSEVSLHVTCVDRGGACAGAGRPPVLLGRAGRHRHRRTARWDLDDHRDQAGLADDDGDRDDAAAVLRRRGRCRARRRCRLDPEGAGLGRVSQGARARGRGPLGRQARGRHGPRRHQRRTRRVPATLHGRRAPRDRSRRSGRGPRSLSRDQPRRAPRAGRRRGRRLRDRDGRVEAERLHVHPRDLGRRGPRSLLRAASITR